jgi:hypothetical protein
MRWPDSVGSKRRLRQVIVITVDFSRRDGVSYASTTLAGSRVSRYSHMIYQAVAWCARCSLSGIGWEGVGPQTPRVRVRPPTGMQNTGVGVLVTGHLSWAVTRIYQSHISISWSQAGGWDKHPPPFAPANLPHSPRKIHLSSRCHGTPDQSRYRRLRLLCAYIPHPVHPLHP